jgi:hypothetical protein
VDDPIEPVSSNEGATVDSDTVDFDAVGVFGKGGRSSSKNSHVHAEMPFSLMRCKFLGIKLSSSDSESHEFSKTEISPGTSHVTGIRVCAAGTGSEPQMEGGEWDVFAV